MNDFVNTNKSEILELNQPNLLELNRIFENNQKLSDFELNSV